MKADTSLTFTFSPNTTWVLPIKSKATLFSWRILWFWQLQVLQSLNLEADDKSTGLPLPHFPPFDSHYQTKFLKLPPVSKSIDNLSRLSKELKKAQKALPDHHISFIHRWESSTNQKHLKVHMVWIAIFFSSVSIWKYTWCGTAFAVRLFQCGLVYTSHSPTFT